MLSNQEVANKIVDMYSTSVEATEYAIVLLNDGFLDKAKTVLEDLSVFLNSIYHIINGLSEQDKIFCCLQLLESCRVSLNRIIGYFTQNQIKQVVCKTEWELLPLIEELRISHAFFAIAYPDVEKMEDYYANILPKWCYNRYMSYAEDTGFYKYDISIVVRAYNNLEYTKLCMDSIRKNMPENLRCELILVNHGSTDETRQYFESLHPDKQLDIAVNRAGVGAAYRIAEGEYFLNVSNDVIITENAIQNLYDCIASDNSIGWAVPTTPNISNLQTIHSEYATMNEMFDFAKKNNKADSVRREQRVRLCNPLDILRMRTTVELGLWDYYHCLNGSFPDDKFSLLLRRKGYKLMLVKDAFCHHFGSITINKEVQNKKIYYDSGRNNFRDIFGIDPWCKGFCYCQYLFNNKFFLKLLEQCAVGEIVGINCGLGSNSLKIKEILREQGKKKLSLINYTTEPEYLADLKGISDHAEQIPGLLKNLSDDNLINFAKCNIMIIESILSVAELKKIKNLQKEQNSIIVLLLKEDSLRKMIKNIFAPKAMQFINKTEKEYWCVIKR